MLIKYFVVGATPRSRNAQRKPAGHAAMPMADSAYVTNYVPQLSRTKGHSSPYMSFSQESSPVRSIDVAFASCLDGLRDTGYGDRCGLRSATCAVRGTMLARHKRVDEGAAEGGGVDSDGPRS